MSDEALPAVVEVEAQDAHELAVPGLGLLVDTTNPAAVADAKLAIDHLYGQLAQARRALVAALEEEAQRVGTRTLRLDGFTVKLSGGSEIEWDHETLRERLAAAGCPEERIDQLIVPVVTYKVNGTVARQLSTNPAYADAITAAQTRVPSSVSAKVEPTAKGTP